MEDNQINGQKISKESYCPNSFFDNGTISIGEFKTLDDAMNFPIKEIWCINRTEDNKFQSYKSQGSRLLIICSWNRSIQDSLKFVVAVIHKDKVGKVYYWDMNDLPLYPEERKNQYEGSLGDDATYTLYQIANNKLNCNTNMNKKLIRLTESDLHKIVKESVNKVLTELDWKTYANAEKKANGKRAQDFRKAKIDAFNRDFSATREPERISNDMYDGYTSKDTYEMKPQKIRLAPWQSEDLPTYERDGKYKRALNSNGKYFNPDDGFDDTFDDINWSLKGYDEFGKKSKMGDKDFRDYSQGKSKYVKGQGWQ